jgi:pyruvate dehydrogenase E1 component beta subunit
VIDLRTLVPLDRETVFNSVAKTGRLLVVDEDYKSFGLTAEIITSVVEHDPSVLKAKPRRIAFPDIPIPYSRPMEQFALPNAEKIETAVREMLRDSAKKAA